MRRSVVLLLNEAKQKMSGYLGLFLYRLMNLCVKAEPASLLSVDIQEGDTSFGLENFAQVAQKDDYHFIIMPKDRGLTSEIVKAIVRAHPEFKYEIKKADEKSNDDDEEAEVYIEVAMPEVNEDRRDLMNDTVDLLYKDCKTHCDLVFDKYTVEIGAKLMQATEEEKKEGKEQLQDLHYKIQEMMDGYKDRKLKEIEDGYQMYLSERQEKEEKSLSKEKAEGKNAGMSMKLFGEEDDE